MRGGGVGGGGPAGFEPDWHERRHAICQPNALNTKPIDVQVVFIIIMY